MDTASRFFDDSVLLIFEGDVRWMSLIFARLLSLHSFEPRGRFRPHQVFVTDFLCVLCASKSTIGAASLSELLVVVIEFATGVGM